MHASGLVSCRRLDFRNVQILPEHVPVLAQLSSVQVLQHSDFQVGRAKLPAAAGPSILMLMEAPWKLEAATWCAIAVAESSEQGPMSSLRGGSVVLWPALLQHDTTKELTLCPAAAVPRQP